MPNKVPWYKLPFVPGFMIGGVVALVLIVCAGLLWRSGFFEPTVCEIMPWANPMAVLAGSSRAGGDCDSYVIKDVPWQEWPEELYYAQPE